MPRDLQQKFSFLQQRESLCLTKFWTISLTEDTIHCEGAGYWFRHIEQSGHGSKTVPVSRRWQLVANCIAEAHRKPRQKVNFPNMTRPATYALGTNARKGMKTLRTKIPLCL